MFTATPRPAYARGRSLNFLGLEIKPQAQLNGPRRIALSVDRAETLCAEIRIRIAEVGPIENIAELSFKPHL